MGIYDREYYQEEGGPRGFQLGGGSGGPRMMVTIVIVITVVVYLAVELFLQGLHPNQHLALSVGQIKEQPWRVYQFLTYGFMHASMKEPGGIFHILFNMFVLYMFGRDIEWRYGRREFLAFYLLAIVFSGVVWWLIKLLTNAPDNYSCVGASGGTVAVTILFCLVYPQRRLYLFGAIEMPAWLLGVMIVVLDLMRALKPSTNISWEGHLAGAAFALLYFKMKLRFDRFLPSKFRFSFRRGPRLKIHQPDTDIVAQGDRLLKKISEQGEESLTAKERKTLEKYSRHIRNQREP